LRLASAWKEELLAEGEDMFSVVRRARLADPMYAERTVTVRAWVDDGVDGGALLIEVSDEGEGFLGQWNPAPIRIADPETVPCSGRGLALMANSVDALRFCRNGATVTLVKHLTAAG
jgi:anti-sigma regulatory factor (Ser/Thr protein kinase)